MGILGGLADLLRSLRKRRSTPSVKLCPRCHKRTLALSSWMDGWITPEVYLCRSCGYRGPVYVEMTLEEYQKWKDGAK
ncbi:MAG: hypothetical protein ACE5GD_05125 [Candidatus Geothermarchaeales archaeon]